MEKVNVSKEEVQTLLADANEFLATFDDCIKHLEERFDFLFKKKWKEPIRRDSDFTEIYKRLLSEGKELMEDNKENREKALCYLKKLEDFFYTSDVWLTFTPHHQHQPFPQSSRFGGFIFTPSQTASDPYM